LESMGNLGKLLIVEDDVALSEFLRELFRSYFEIRIAHDGQAGYDLARTFLPDCIVSDVRMPRLSGINMLKKIRQTPGLETVGVILLTVLSDTKDRIRGYDHFADLYFTKPFESEELVSATVGLVMMRQQMRRVYSGEKALEFQAANKHLSDDDEKFLHLLSDIVEAHISEYDINIETIALATNSTIEELKERIDDLEGITPEEYFMQVKLEHAKILADTGEAYSLNDLATQVGFRDPELFREEYQNHFGYAPQIKPRQ